MHACVLYDPEGRLRSVGRVERAAHPGPRGRKLSTNDSGLGGNREGAGPEQGGSCAAAAAEPITGRSQPSRDHIAVQS
jgi:hypothetical protein